jgi:thiamine kinase-like enzyme
MLITSPDKITPEWLTDTLRDGGYLPYFRVLDARLLNTYASQTATLYTLRIKYSDVSIARKMPDSMVLKVYHPGYIHADKEVTFYSSILPSLRKRYGDADLFIVDGYDAYYDVAEDQSHILIEGIPTGFKKHFEPIPPTKRHMTQIADALAKTHAYWWNDERLGDTIGIATTEEKIDKMLDKQLIAYETFLSDRLIILQPRQREILNLVVGKMPSKRKQRLIEGDAVTLIHNDLTPDNLLYSHNACRILDWKHWRLGLGIEDLAYMMPFYWGARKRKFEEPRLLKRYWGELNRLGIKDYSYNAMMLDYRVSIGLRIGDIMGAWRKEDWQSGKWAMWKTLVTGMQAFDDFKVGELFS